MQEERNREKEGGKMSQKLVYQTCLPFVSAHFVIILNTGKKYTCIVLLEQELFSSILQAGAAPVQKNETLRCWTYIFPSSNLIADQFFSRKSVVYLEYIIFFVTFPIFCLSVEFY